MALNRRTLKNTATPTQKMIGEVNLRPDFDSSFSSQMPGMQNTYGEFNTNGEEFYTPTVGSFFIDCSRIHIGGKPPSAYSPVLVEVPLIEGGFGRFATSSFTPAEFGVSSSIPAQQSYKDVFDNNINNTRFQRNSIELTYTIINNSIKPIQNSFERTTPKHKMLISTWNAYGMNTMTTDADGNVVLPNEPNVMTHSHIPRTFDYTGAGLDDPDYDYGGINNNFYQTADPYYGANTFSGYGLAQTLTILDGEMLQFSPQNAPIGNTNAIIYNTAGGPNDIHFYPPRVIASSRINPGPNYLQLTPVFQFFLANSDIFVKGMYRIY